MAKITQTPGSVLSGLIKKHRLNYNRLAKAVGLSSAMVRLIARDENPISAPVAFRLAKFFKNKPEFWLDMQMDFAISQSNNDKRLKKALDAIPTVDTATFERKKKAKKTDKPVKSAAKKTSGKRGRPAKVKTTKVPVKKRISAKKAVKKPAPKKAAVKKATVKKPVVKKAKAAVKKPAVKKVVVKKPAVKKAKPAVKKPVVKVIPQPQPQPQPVIFPEVTINEPQI